MCVRVLSNHSNGVHCITLHFWECFLAFYYIRLHLFFLNVRPHSILVLSPTDCNNIRVVVSEDKRINNMCLCARVLAPSSILFHLAPSSIQVPACSCCFRTVAAAFVSTLWHYVSRVHLKSTVFEKNSFINNCGLTF